MKTIDLLRDQFPGQVLIPVIEAGRAMGLAPATTRNRIWSNRFPLRTVKNGDKRLVNIIELANYIDGLGSVSKRGRGRPRKE